ncbi:hypothetical protein BT63DRAFT_461102 [Microthyrium microscopicum]|uniref:ER membrane protein complex subunit 4 n=1 Tax=Microthyrium microscopicum TaxID=703497 RepID=A0A6A6TV92_9PEZI|nr:hypothetical protein BT63DRAFT_461102 [Microthyrium microscopicum]
MSSKPSTPEWVARLQSTPKRSKNNSNIVDPPGYTPNTTKKGPKDKQPARKLPTTEETDTLKIKKAWEVAIAPAKQLPMSAIGMYMTGNTLQIFSIMMVFMLFKTPITSVIAIQNTFSRFETEGTRDKILLAKIAFILCNMLSLALGIWKVNAMGLLPTTTSDWLMWEPMRTSLEKAVPLLS